MHAHGKSSFLPLIFCCFSSCFSGYCGKLNEYKHLLGFSLFVDSPLEYFPLIYSCVWLRVIKWVTMKPQRKRQLFNSWAFAVVRNCSKLQITILVKFFYIKKSALQSAFKSIMILFPKTYINIDLLDANVWLEGLL